MMTMKFCAAHPCKNVVPVGQRYCPDHAHLDPQRQKAVKPFYTSARWQRFRAWYIRQHPLCVECERHGLLIKADIVDHVIEIEDGGDLLSEDNCQSLCRSCHNQKTAEAAKNRKKSSAR